MKRAFRHVETRIVATVLGVIEELERVPLVDSVHGTNRACRAERHPGLMDSSDFTHR